MRALVPEIVPTCKDGSVWCGGSHKCAADQVAIVEDVRQEFLHVSVIHGGVVEESPVRPEQAGKGGAALFDTINAH